MSSFRIKIMAVILMVIDHMGVLFFPEQLIFRCIGRISFPLFAFQVVKGFEHTKSREKYILRMLILAAIAQIPFWLFLKAAIPNIDFTLNIATTFAVGLLLLYVIEEVKPWILKVLMFILIIFLTLYVPFEYGWFGVSLILILYLFRNSKVALGFVYFCLIGIYCYAQKSIFPLPAIYSLIPMILYNGKQGQKIKYLFYIFYPLHFAILLGIKFLIG